MPHTKWKIERVPPGDPRLPKGSKGIALPTGEVLYTTPASRQHELAHVQLGHLEKWKHRQPRGDIHFWQEVDANVYALIKSHFDPNYQELLNSFWDELSASKPDQLFYARKSISRLLKRGHITTPEALTARHYLSNK